MVSIHPDFYNMTFRLKPDVPMNEGDKDAIGTIKPIAAYSHKGDIYVVGINTNDGDVVEFCASWLTVVPPDAA